MGKKTHKMKPPTWFNRLMNLKCSLKPFSHPCSRAETQVPWVLAQLSEEKQTLRQGISQRYLFWEGIPGNRKGIVQRMKQKIRAAVP